MKCPHCQQQIAAGVKFCAECGQRIATTIEQDASIEQMRTRVGGQSLGQMPTQMGAGERGTTGIGVTLGGRYELLEELWRGGFAVVYRARGRKLHREVALNHLVK